MSSAQVSFLPDGRRLHLHHGPIDLIVDVTGAGREVALRRAAARFETVLEELVSDLEHLRRPVGEIARGLNGVAGHMQRAALAHLPEFVTPMAAVAGAVADEIARVIGTVPDVDTASVNNGGDVALVLAKGQALTAAMGWGVRARVSAEMPVRGIATSGWRGRSHSLGIADAVTVLADTAAKADVAATLIANHVDLPGHKAIDRRPAQALFPDSDLGDRLVTVGVGSLTPHEIRCALQAGASYAARCLQMGLIHGVWLTLGGQMLNLGATDEVMISKETAYA